MFQSCPLSNILSLIFIYLILFLISLYVRTYISGSTASIGKAPLADLKSGLATAPTLFAAEEYPQLTTLIGRKFEGEGDIELAVELVKRSQGE